MTTAGSYSIVSGVLSPGPPPAEPLYVDNSTLSAVANCLTHAHLRYYLGYTVAAERAPLLAGTAAHLAMAAWLRGSTKPEALTTFETAYRAWADENILADDTWNARLAWPNLNAILDRWFDEHPVADFSFRVDPKLVEIGFAYPLTDDGSIVYCGRIDAIVRDAESDHLYILETKTTGEISAPWLKTFRLDSQLSGYIWAAQQHVGDTNVVGAYVNAIEFSKLPSSATKCRGGRGIESHGVPYSECGPLHAKFMIPMVDRTPEEIALWRGDAIRLARIWRRLRRAYPTADLADLVPQPGKFHQSCKFCEFYDWCEVRRPLHLIDSMLVQSPWSPYDRATVAKETT